MAGDNMDPEARVALTEIKGDLKLVLAGQERTNSDIVDIRQNVRDHGNRIITLENDKFQRVGERQGVAISTKLFWTIITALCGGLLAVVTLILTR